MAQQGKPLWLSPQTAGNAPIGISMTPGSLTCLANQAGSTTVATLSEIGGTGISTVFSVTGNANLTVVGNNLRTVVSPTFSAGVNQTFSLHVTDTGGTFNDGSPRTLTVPAGPSGITHNPDTVLDNATLGTVVSTLTPIGGTSPYTWSIVSGFSGYLDIVTPGNTSTLTLNSSGVGHLTAGVPLTGNIQVTDAAGISTGSVAVSVSVSHAASAPTGVTTNPTPISIASTQAGNSTIATLTEVGGTGVSVVFSVTGNANLTVSGSNLRTVGSPSFSPGVNQTYTLSVTDTGGTYTDPSPRTLTVLAVPTGISQTPGSLTCLANQAGSATVATLAEIGGTSASVVFSVTGNANLTTSGSNLNTVGSPTFSAGVNQTYTLSVTDTGGTFTDPAPRTLTVPAGPTAISFSGTTVVDNAPAGTNVGVLSTTGGTAPFTYTCSNSKFSISGSTVSRSASGSLTAGVAESLNFTSTDAAALVTNTATNGQGPFSVSVSAHGALSLPLTLNNLSPATSYTAPFVSYSQPLADGDVPAGGSLTAVDSLSNPVTVQMDAVALWPSGCPRWVVLSHACAETFAGASTKTYTYGSSASAPNNTPNSGTWGGAAAANWAATLAANSDIKAIYSGFDAGASTYTVSMNTIFSTYTFTANEAWGTSYPTGGWSITKQGPVCIEFHGWQYITNDTAPNKTQGYVRCDIWVKAWSPTGPYEVDVRTSMPNMWNTVPLSSSAEQFNVRAGRWATLLTLKNGSSVVFNAGGPSDTNATTVANANFNIGTNQLTAALNTFFPQTGVVFAASGALPAGISANTIYYPGYTNGGTANPWICTQRGYAAFIEQNSTITSWAANTAYGVGTYRKNGTTIYICVVAGTSAASGGPTGTGTSIVDGSGSLRWANVTVIFGDQGSGTISAYPVYASFPSVGWHVGDALGNPIWIGSGTRPPIFPGHNFSYLTTKSQFTLPYNIGAGFQATDRTVPVYGPTTNFGGIQWALSATGDGAADQRIGYMSGIGVTSLFNPSDPYYTHSAVQASLDWSQYPYGYMNDESGGNPFVGNNGTNNSGTPYTNLPSLIPNWNGNNIAGNVATSVQARGAAWSQWSQAAQDFNGFTGQYYASTPGSHMPALWQVAYLKTGRPCFLEQGIHMANTQCFMLYQSKQTLSGKTYYCLINGNYGSCQLRGWAWALRSLSQCLYMLPSTHIFYPVLRDYYNDNAEFQAGLIATYTPAQATFGMLRCLDHGTTGNTSQGHLAPWMGYFLYYGIAMDVWRNLNGATAQAHYKTVLDYMAAQWNLYTTSVDPNAINYISAYDLVYSPITGQSNGYSSSYTSASAVWTASYSETAEFTGSISGTTLTVTAVASGTLVNQGQITQAGGIFAANGQKITAGGPGGVGSYTVSPGSTTSSRTMFQSSSSASVVPGPPYLTNLYDQNATNYITINNFPANCNWYGSIARAALTLHNLATPGNATIQAVLAAILAATESATGLGSSTAGIQWFGPKAGHIENYQTFAVF